LIIAGAAISSGGAPFRRNPSLDEHSLQCGIERAFFHLEDILGETLNGIGDFIAMEFTGASEGFEDEEMEGTGRNFVALHDGSLA
jgi:hypothetical protein